MTIVIVVDCFIDKSNGTAVSANNLAKMLKIKGHNVRVVAPYVKGDGFYEVKERWIPLVTYISHKQHMHFGEADEKTLREAFKGADLVHFFLPFKLEIVGVKIAREMKIPYMSGFHLQPENITYNAHLTKIPFIHQFIFWLFHYRIYKYVKHIHCPSKLIKDELIKHRYNAKLYVISNGFTPQLQKLKKQKIDNFFHIIMTGRYTQEKRQDILIEAVFLSKYEKNIKLHIKGLGPREEEYKRLSAKLTHGADLGFVSDLELAKLYSYADLYVHTSDVDGESIAALEAISNGIVPIISNSKMSATKQFALNDDCLFEAGDARDLAKKIDYFIENQSYLQELSAKYENISQTYDLSSCVDKMIEMYNDVLRDFKNTID
ncbi:glycosyl transferase [Helicobacter sp. 16-1353]|uniref:glycosyltransferase n=1 Tax=Helicobacter sp. 16-1353 TaxID=2004996 RepID=UPI000DCBCCEB|nr:glycosyltransferase [Helicobacter sp. 16-1353]RAX55185.1 glycosyl transferase [Helicobacter sp. 16-1353]